MYEFYDFGLEYVCIFWEIVKWLDLDVYNLGIPLSLHKHQLFLVIMSIELLISKPQKVFIANKYFACKGKQNELLSFSKPRHSSVVFSLWSVARYNHVCY